LALQVTNFKECLRPNVNLFHSHGEAYATVKVEGHFEMWPIRSQEFKTLLRYRWFIRAKTVTPIFILGIPVPMPRTIPKPVLNDMLDEAEATAQFEGDERQIFLLVAAHTDDVYIDLCDDQWRVIHITADSWMIEESFPVVRFIRKQGMLPLPVPVHDPNALQHLNEFVAHLEKDGRILCKGFLLGALNPEGPYPLQVVVGEQGTGKSTICEIAKLLIDPTKPLTAAMPHGKRDLAIAAANSWLQVYDNISKISPEMSDSLCQLATTFGYKTRKLYSDATEMIFEATRPILLCSRNAGLIIAGDLADRSLFTPTRIFPEAERRPHKKVMADFETKRAGILGVLYDAVSAAIRRRGTADAKTRMADFASWVVAGETELGLQPGEFMEAYNKSRANAGLSALEASPLHQPLMVLVSDRRLSKRWTKDVYKDDMTTLLADLVSCRTGTTDFPNNPRGLQEQLSYIAPLLRPLGIKITFLGYHPVTRRSQVQIERPAKPVSVRKTKMRIDPSEASDASKVSVQ
jgi:putative DNA primase/helicase